MARTDRYRREYVAKLAAIIDKLKPRGWASKIPARFNLEDGGNCVTYHVFGSYWEGTDLMEREFGRQIVGALSDDEEFHDFWVDEINKRRRSRKLPYRYEVS
jgi:hypothetical protein